MSYSVEIIAAASRVGKTFETGCDRCSADDLVLLENAGLMTTRKCTKDDEWHMDSLEAGEQMWEFNNEGQALVNAILQNNRKARYAVCNNPIFSFCRRLPARN
jgi:hypothetical protein